MKVQNTIVLIKVAYRFVILKIADYFFFFFIHVFFSFFFSQDILRKMRNTNITRNNLTYDFLYFICIQYNNTMCRKYFLNQIS